MMWTKEECKQANDELDLKHTQDKGIDQKFAEKLRQFELNPDLSFLGANLANKELLVAREVTPPMDCAGNKSQKFVTFRALSPLQAIPVPDYEDDDSSSDNDELLKNIEVDERPLPDFNPLEDEILFEIKKSTEILLSLSRRQREIQDALEIACTQRDHDGIDNDRIGEFNKQLNDMLIPLQTLSVTLGGFNINLKLVRENDIRRVLVAEPERVEKPSVLHCKRK